jgi:hypothetical protein
LVLAIKKIIADEYGAEVSAEAHRAVFGLISHAFVG